MYIVPLLGAEDGKEAVVQNTTPSQPSVISVCGFNEEGVFQLPGSDMSFLFPHRVQVGQLRKFVNGLNVLQSNKKEVIQLIQMTSEQVVHLTVYFNCVGRGGIEVTDLYLHVCFK